MQLNIIGQNSNNTTDDNNSNQSENDGKDDEEEINVEDTSEDPEIDNSIMILSGGVVGLLTILLIITFMIRRK